MLVNYTKMTCSTFLGWGCTLKNVKKKPDVSLAGVSSRLGRGKLVPSDVNYSVLIAGCKPHTLDENSIFRLINIQIWFPVSICIWLGLALNQVSTGVVESFILYSSRRYLACTGYLFIWVGTKKNSPALASRAVENSFSKLHRFGFWRTREMKPL